MGESVRKYLNHFFVNKLILRHFLSFKIKVACGMLYFRFKLPHVETYVCIGQSMIINLGGYTIVD